jgi:glutathione S-transferase
MEKPLLLGSQGCGNVIVECAFALAGIGHDYEEVDYSDDSPTRPRLLQVNPLGQVPTLVLPDGEVMTESLAMLHWIQDEAPRRPVDPAERRPHAHALLSLGGLPHRRGLSDFYLRRRPEENGSAMARPRAMRSARAPTPTARNCSCR